MTTQQLGDACEMLVAAELTLAGVPTLKAPYKWPHYDLVAQRPGKSAPERISVKARTYTEGSTHVAYDWEAQFEWLAVVILNEEGQGSRKVYIIPRDAADQLSKIDGPKAKTTERYWLVREVHKRLHNYQDNFRLLDPTPPDMLV